MTPQGLADLRRLYSETDFQPGLHHRSSASTMLRRTSYLDYLRKTVGVGDETVTLLKNIPNPFWGLNYDALSALEGYRLGQPGFTGLPFDAVDDHYPDDEPYIFHFPDGNAAIARLLVRKLIPGDRARSHDGRHRHRAIRLRASRRNDVTDPDPPQQHGAARTTRSDAGVVITYARGGVLERVRGQTMRARVLQRDDSVSAAGAARSAAQRAGRSGPHAARLHERGVAKLEVVRQGRRRPASTAPTGYYAFGMLDFPVSLGAVQVPEVA